MFSPKTLLPFSTYILTLLAKLYGRAAHILESLFLAIITAKRYLTTHAYLTVFLETSRTGLRPEVQKSQNV